MNGVTRLEAAAKSVAHKGGIVASILRSFRPAAAAEMAVQTCAAAGAPRDHGGVEVGHPFPDETMQVVHAEEIGSSPPDERKGWRRGRGVPSSHLAHELGIVPAVRASRAGGGRVFPF